MQPIDLLTELDKARIHKYVRTFNHGAGYASQCDVDHYLRFWNEEKSKYLFDLFGQKLILSLPVSYDKDIEELACDIVNWMDNDDELAFTFRNQMTAIFGWRTIEYDYVRRLFDQYVLAANEFTYGYEENFSVPLPNGKPLKWQKGARPMRIIRKLAEAYGIEGFDYFMNGHSQCLNQKHINGILHMSIHPMDYMTMSDNDEGWDSCMSWESDGCYKQGTVEMMNSPCVVVGYLESDHRKYWFNAPDADESEEVVKWNSKKWRSLFIVDKDFIVNIKEYPYENTNLVQECVKLLAATAGWGDVELRSFAAHQNNVYPDRQVHICFTTGAMYNDFGYDHWLAMNPAVENANYFVSGYCYSGPSMCVWCGGIDDVGESGNETCLMCGECDGRRRCDCCGERLPYNEDYWYWVGNDCVCESCWESKTTTDEMTEETIYSENAIDLYLNSTYAEKDITENRWRLENIEIEYDSWRTHEHLWENYFTIKAPRRVEYKTRWGYTDYAYYVNVEDCTPLGLERLFDLCDQDDINDYLGVEEETSEQEQD